MKQSFANFSFFSCFSSLSSPLYLPFTGFLLLTSHFSRNDILLLILPAHWIHKTSDCWIFFALNHNYGRFIAKIPNICHIQMWHFLLFLPSFFLVSHFSICLWNPKFITSIKEILKYQEPETHSTSLQSTNLKQYIFLRKTSSVHLTLLFYFFYRFSLFLPSIQDSSPVWIFFVVSFFFCECLCCCLEDLRAIKSIKWSLLLLHSLQYRTMYTAKKFSFFSCFGSNEAGGQSLLFTFIKYLWMVRGSTEHQL